MTHVKIKTYAGPETPQFLRPKTAGKQGQRKRCKLWLCHSITYGYFNSQKHTSVCVQNRTQRDISNSKKPSSRSSQCTEDVTCSTGQKQEQDSLKKNVRINTKYLLSIPDASTRIYYKTRTPVIHPSFP